MVHHYLRSLSHHTTPLTQSNPFDNIYAQGASAIFGGDSDSDEDDGTAANPAKGRSDKAGVNYMMMQEAAKNKSNKKVGLLPYLHHTHYCTEHTHTPLTPARPPAFAHNHHRFHVDRFFSLTRFRRIIDRRSKRGKPQWQRMPPCSSTTKCTTRWNSPRRLRQCGGKRPSLPTHAPSTSTLHTPRSCCSSIYLPIPRPWCFSLSAATCPMNGTERPPNLLLCRTYTSRVVIQLSAQYVAVGWPDVSLTVTIECASAQL